MNTWLENSAAIITTPHFVPAGLRKCGIELPKIRTVVLGTQRQIRWQQLRGAGRPNLTRFARMLADERLGRG